MFYTSIVKYVVLAFQLTQFGFVAETSDFHVESSGFPAEISAFTGGI
jgi:hypothetical protein